MDEPLSAADSSGAKFTFPTDNTVQGRILKLETDHKVSTATLSEQMRNMNTNLTNLNVKIDNLNVKIDNLMWKFLTFGVGTVLLGVGAFAGKMKGDMLGTVEKLIKASETSIKSEIKIEIAKEVRASEDRILLKLDQMKTQK